MAFSIRLRDYFYRISSVIVNRIRIYEKVIEQLGVEPSSCFFIDDLPENIEAARALGMQAELFLPAVYENVIHKADQFFGWNPLVSAAR